MNIGIIGAGNIGTYLAAYISLKKDYKVYFHTTKPHLFNEEIILNEEEKNIRHKVKIHKITSNLEEATKESDLILITHPSFMMEKTLKEISKYIKKGAVVGAIPGFGGKEYFIDEIIENGGIFFGSQRVPSITRLVSYGKEVDLKQKNPFMKISVIPSIHKEEVCRTLTNLIDIPCIPLKNYLGITLSPSNPTMHPSRLYELFKDFTPSVTYSRNPLFYEEWGDDASSMLLALDEELTSIYNVLNKNNDFEVSDFEKIKTRYNIKTPSELTNKINTATGFQGITSPMVQKEDYFIPDLNSRYFIEDLDFGLCIIKAFGEICNVETPTVDKVIYWAQNLLDKEYLINGKLEGADIGKLTLPQNKNLHTVEDVISYYTSL